MVLFSRSFMARWKANKKCLNFQRKMLILPKIYRRKWELEIHFEIANFWPVVYIDSIN
jgi:hypothetical protein